MDTRDALRAAERQYRDREVQLGVELAAARAVRDDAMRAAHQEGLTTREIARIVSLSHQRVWQILRGE